MDRFEHLATMFNVRTKNKKYENYIVNAIYNKVGNTELTPITQQYVKSKKDNRYYLMDLYFPQINYGVEIDEMQHIGKQHTIDDKQRAEAIKEAIKCNEKRIEIYHKVSENAPVKMRTFEDITTQIDECVSEIKELIEKKEQLGEPLKWLSDEEEKEKVLQNGLFSVSDDVNFKGFKEIASILGYYIPRHCGVHLNNGYYLWVPHLAVMDDNGNIINSRNGWENFLSNDGESITEVDSGNKMVKNPTRLFDKDLLRVVFLRMKDQYGKPCCKFIGVFKPDDYVINDNGHIERHYKRVANEVKLDLLKR